MNYIIYDLEFNQEYLHSSEVQSANNSSLPFEIIQIGALKLTENFETVANFNSLIKPTVYPIIHPYVESLTKINDSMVSSCETFPQVYEDFLEFIGNDETTLCVWGISDIKELLRNIKFYNLPSSTISKNYIDIQKYASKHLRTPNKSRIGLSTAISLLNIPTNGQFHDAFNDAYYTTEVFKHIYNNNIKTTTYIPNFSRRVKQSKEKIDTVALINQFEKMYNREMSLEEESMIKLAYIMGKTRQFVIESNLSNED
ncbi:3'-5' exonuclease [Clostridium cellulovorans]|uniref:Exonuclease RNase T and DNA polymerase III n=1 Tax=Clostridium cellulovorans (strain ATCC 35296 / DSM 3052 / OCM 3 / 743B) TaxID=573061 RepID=D9SNH6_CLOC7|nr:3'-5' exonuclease [Clostridium cellulovorans]ADL53968.1 Exonuclease RNase T and DNA polymerase III [Clostridium cellulovorans 743B]